MFGNKNKKKKNNNNKFQREEYFSNRDYRRTIMRKKKKSVSNGRKIAIGFGFVFLFLISLYVINLFRDLPSLYALENPKTDIATRVYSEDGELIDKFYIENRTIVSIDAIPKDLINALIATEDKKFYNHWGVDLDRIAKAFVKNLVSLSVKEGASTITQQLARNLYASIGMEQTLNRKIKEAITAVQIEKTYTKEEILILYLNQVYFGRGAYGVEAAARTFFDKNANELTLDESATLVAMLKNPSGAYDPNSNPEACIERRNLVLNNMLEDGFITREVYELTKNDPVLTRSKKEVTARTTSNIASQFSEYIRQQLERKAEKYGFNIYRDGLVVTTTLDSRYQKHAVDAVTEHLKSFQKTFNSTWNWKSHKSILNDAIDRTIKEEKEYKNAKTDADRQKIYNRLKNDEKFVEAVKEKEIAVQVGFVVIDPKNGHIKAMVGQNPNYPFKYGLNHVTQIKRQPGSSFKPFVYATAIDNGYSPAYNISNDPLRVMIGGRPWEPKGGGTGGEVTMRTGIQHSINIVAVRVAMELAPIDQVIKLAHKMGITTDLPNVLSLALGVGDVSPLDMTNAFGVFANEGIWVEPISILRIEDRNGNVLEDNVPETREAISEGVAFIMADMMEDVLDGGTASVIRQWFHRPAAGKTGTTQDFTDAWFVGYTPQLSAGVWVGFDDPRIKFGGWYGQGGKAAAPIWGRFMKYVYDDPATTMPLVYFEMPSEVEETDVCMVTGLKANETCPAVYDLVLKKYANKTCSIQHAMTDSTKTESSSEPPPGSIGF
jgi:penicillin-binding protein 1A